MKAGRPSLTAVYVALARACATDDPDLSRLCRDEAAARLLPAPLGALLAYARSGPSGALLGRALRRSSLGMFEHLALRTHVIDEAVSQAADAGVRQLVLLGAGLDARAHRLLSLRDVTVFEIDHPSTQSQKRRKAQTLPVCARALRYAACDFRQVKLARALRGTGFDGAVPSIWIWEGVTMYLPRAAIDDTLETLALLSAPGSRLICSYLTPATSFADKWLAALGQSVLGWIAEPICSHFTQPAIAAALEARGFGVVSDVRPSTLAAQYGIHLPAFSPATPSERIVIADKRATRPA